MVKKGQEKSKKPILGDSDYNFIIERLNPKRKLFSLGILEMYTPCTKEYLASRLAIVELLQNGLNMAAPTLAHFLLGFDVHKGVARYYIVPPPDNFFFSYVLFYIFCDCILFLYI